MKPLETAKRILSKLATAPSTDPDDARRRRLLDILLLCIVAFVIIEFVMTKVVTHPGVLAPGRGVFYPSIALVLVVAAIIFAINRYWSGQLAGLIFVLSFVASVLLGDPVEATSGRGLLVLAVPITMASIVLHPHTSFLVAGLVTVGVTILGLGVLQTGLDVSVILAYFLIAHVSWIAARNLQSALQDLRIGNRELDQRVADRTRDLERRSVQLQTASEVARDATATLNVEKLLDDTVHLIHERFGFYHAAVFLLDERGEYAILRAVCSEYGQRLLQRGLQLPVGKAGIVGHVAGSGERLVVLDMGESAAQHIHPDLSETRSEIALPLISRGRVIGVLDVQSKERAIFTEEDVATLQTMADQLANAIENARLYAAELQRRQETETLYRATQALATTLDLRHLFERILRELRQVVPYDSASVQLLQDSRLEIIGGHGFPNLDELLGINFDISRQSNPNGEVLRLRGPFIVDDAPAVYPEFRRDPHAAAGIRSWLGVPLMLGDQIIGMLALDKREAGYYTSEHAKLALAFAAQAAVAIEKARLYDDARRHVEELTALHNIDIAITSTLELDEVLRIIYQQVKEILDVACFYIALYDRQRDEIEVRFIVDRGRRLPSQTLRVGEGDGFAGRVVRTREPLWIQDLELERPGLPVEHFVVGDAIRSLLVLPLVVREQVVGLISAQSPDSNAFNEDDRRLLSGIAHQAAIAIGNAQLYEEARRRLSEARLIQEVTLAAASTLDFDLVLERTVKALHRALGIDRLGFLLPDDRGDVLIPHPSLFGFAEGSLRIHIRDSQVGQVYRSGRPLLVQGAVCDSGYPEQPPEVRSALAVPVWVGGRIVAVMRAESYDDGAFGEDELRIFTTVAGQLGVTLENARLYQAMARHARDLRLLADASGGIIASLEPHEIAAHLLNVLAERFRVPCGISLLGPDAEYLEVVAGWMPDGQLFPLPSGSRVCIAEQRGLKRVMEDQQLVYTPDLEQSEWWALLSHEEREATRKHGTKAVLIVPMLGRERMVGVVSLRFPEPLPEPVDEQINWVQTLVNQAAAALANAQLYQQLETQASELSQAYEELREIDRLRAQVVQNVSHELRTPLTLIKGYIELFAAGDLGQVLDNQRVALQVIRERTATLSRLIHNLTMLQSVPREALALAQVSIAEVLQTVLAEFRRPASDSNISYCMRLEENLPPIWGDQERLELVFGNLVDNAIKFSPDGGTVTLHAWADQETVFVSVADEGIGIAPSYLGRIFERFYQVDGSTRRRFGGMGIGLALVWEIVEAHGGSVRVESEPGQGSAFTVLLPQADVS